MTTTFRPKETAKNFLSKEKLDCSLLCAEPFVSFRRHEKKGKERLEEEYKSKEVRLKTTEQNKNEPRSLQQGRDDTDRGFGLANPALH